MTDGLIQHEVGLWVALNKHIPMAKPRVEIPRSNKAERLRLAAAIYAKHVELGASSPLKDLNWTTVGPMANTAIAADTLAKQLERDLEKAYGERDALLEPVDKEIARSRDLLLALYADNPRKLGDFGFTVIVSPKAAKKTQQPAE